MKKNLLLLLCLLMGLTVGFAQQTDLQTLRTEANLKSGNNRDILTNFFQLALNDLTGPDKQLRFSANLFALKLKANPNLDIDTNYIHQKFWRNSNLDFTLRLGDRFAFNGAALGYRIAVINKRDFSSSDEFLKELSWNFGSVGQIASRSLPAIMASAGENDQKFNQLKDELNSFLKDSTLPFSSLSPELQTILETSLQTKLTPDFNYKLYTKAKADETIQRYHDKFLWTVDLQAVSYPSAKLFQQINLNSRASAGMGRIKKQHSLEYDLRAGLFYGYDTLSKNGEEKRGIASAEGGLNLVLRHKASQQSFLECKASLIWQNLWSGKRLGEEPHVFFLAGTFNIRITESIWIPVRVQYNPEEANVLGYFSVKSNFDWLQGILGK